MLFLGTSETVGEFADLFATLDRKSKLYRAQGRHARRTPSARGGCSFRHGWKGAPAARPSARPPGDSELPLRELTERALLQQYAPAGALVNERGDILYLHGRTGQYLEPAPGEAGMNILKMAREGLRRELTTALHKAVAHQGAGAPPGAAGQDQRRLHHRQSDGAAGQRSPGRGDGAGPVPGHLRRRRRSRAAAPELGRRRSTAEGAGGTARTATRASRRLKQELRAKEEYLQTYHRGAGDLQRGAQQSSNEEMQSVNEELQSTNEELETSKEELQSVNEELATVNAELQQKVADLSRANNDMNNLLAGTGIGTIFVDHQLRIQRFTPAVTQVINLIPTDVGRPVGHIVSNLSGYDRLVEDVQAVLDSLVPREVEVQTKAGAWYSLRIRPYRTLENVIEGAVITFLDITEMKRAREAQRESESLCRLAVVVRDARDAVTVQDLAGCHLAWNPAAERTVRLERDRGAGDERPRPDPREPACKRAQRGRAAGPSGSLGALPHATGRQGRTDRGGLADRQRLGERCRGNLCHCHHRTRNRLRRTGRGVLVKEGARP